jgi:hypothetical protein
VGHGGGDGEQGGGRYGTEEGVELHGLFPDQDRLQASTTGTIVFRPQMRGGLERVKPPQVSQASNGKPGSER